MVFHCHLLKIGGFFMTIKNLSKWGRFLLPILLIFSLLLTPFGPSIHSDAARATGTVKNRILNVRSSASTSSSIVCKLTQGSKVTILSETTGDDGLKWYNVYFAYNGDAKEGFVRADLVNVSGNVSGTGSSNNNASLSTSDPSSSSSGTKYVKPNVAIIRTYASTNADIRSRLDRGTSVTILNTKTGADDGRTWYKISFTKNGTSMDGYIRGDLLVDTNPGGNSASSNSTDVSGTRYTALDTVCVYTYASTNGDIRSRLSKGTPVSLMLSKTGEDGMLWYKVSYTDSGYNLNGYIRSNMLTDVNPGSSSGGGSSETPSSGTSATVKPAVANIRTYASTNADIRSKLSQGTNVTIDSEKTGDDGRKWYKISYSFNGIAMTGYIRSDLLNIGSTNNNSSSGTNSGSNSNPSSGGAEVRTYASPNADVRATLQNGTKVAIIKEVTGDDGQKWTKISFTQNGETLEGYVPSSMLK